MKEVKEYEHFKLIDGRSGNAMGFTIKVEKGHTLDEVKLSKIKDKAAIKKNCPVEMIEVQSYRPIKKRSKT